MMMYFVDRSAVTLKPTAKFLAWLNEIESKNPDAISLTLEQIKSNCTIFLVKETENPEEIVAYIDERYEDIFKVELASWYTDETYWPSDMSLQAFWEFFEVEIHDVVLDMEDSDMQIEKLDDPST